MPSSNAASSDDDITPITNNEPSVDGSDSEQQQLTDEEEDNGVEEEEEEVEEEEEGEEEEPEEGDEEEEVEEEEEEQEEEVEEVEGVEEEVDDDEEEEKPTDSLDSLSPIKDDRNDNSQEEGHVEALKLEKPKQNLATDVCTAKDSGGRRDSPIEPVEIQGKEIFLASDVLGKDVDTSGESLAGNEVIGSQPEKEVLTQNKHDEVDCSDQDPIYNSKSTQAEQSKSLYSDEKEVASVVPKRDGSGHISDSVQHFEEEIEQMDIDSRDDVKLRASSSITPQIRPRSSSPGVEFGDRNKKPAQICEFFAKGWCIKGNSCRFIHQKEGVDNTGKGSKVERKVDAGGVGKETDGPSKPLPGESHWKFPSLNDNPNHQSPFMGDKRSMISSSIYGNSSSSFAFDKGISPLGSSPLGAMKSIDGGRGYYASISSLSRSSSSPFYSRYEQENLSARRNLGEHLSFTGHLAQFKAYSWEPSVPFRPSFHLSSIISIPGAQYDPLRDSIEPHSRTHSSLRSPFSKALSIHKTSAQQTNGDSVSFNLQPQNVVSEINTITHGLGAYATSAEAKGTFTSEQQNQNLIIKEEKPIQNPSLMVKDEKPVKRHVRNTSYPKEVDLDLNPIHQADGIKPTKESKTLKLFRASLVEFVKEMVKPSWREGHLSKDAHNMVVKKAVEKVLSTIQPHQIPTTTESTDQYLSSSRPKIAKLVEGYVGKYGKS